MNDYTVKRLALVLAIQSEIEGAKLDNQERIYNQIAFSIGLNYPPEWFEQKAKELRTLAYAHDEQL